jgi:hypothetical protein
MPAPSILSSSLDNRVTQEISPVTQHPDSVEPVTREIAPVRQLPGALLAELTELLDWWRPRKEELSKMAPSIEPPMARPIFKRGGGAKGPKTITKTIRLSPELVARAVAEAKKQRATTGGTFSELVELLLWRFVGRPDDLVEPDDLEGD